jgi:SAM-dependent methyltransferase
MKDFWEQRYSEKDYAYGMDPNQFFKIELDKLNVGSILLPAEGEGRNAVYAAKLGWEVSAFDYSEAAKEKAVALAEREGVALDYQVCEVLQYSPNTTFDVIGLSYTHFGAAIRAQAFSHLLSLLKPKGHVIFEAFSKEQLQYSSGGPKNAEMLFSEVEIRQLFSHLNFHILQECIIELDEGRYHQGKAAVVQFVGQLKD